MKKQIEFSKLPGSGTSCVVNPRITFQDTNVVGNVYFLTFFRWQAECRDQWLRTARPEMWKQVWSGERPLIVTQWSTHFEDPFGATIGDDVTVTLSFNECDQDTISASADVVRKCDSGPTRIATGNMIFTARADFDPPQNDHPNGPCYSFIVTPPFASNVNPLDLLGWQGKCRELFLDDHAADSLQLVAKQELILQTTTASLELVSLPSLPMDQVRVEMRLETIKCGQMGVRFDYFVELPQGTSVRFAKGQQKMSSKHRSSDAVVPCPFPADLLNALRQFTESEQLLAKIDDILSFSMGTTSPSYDRVIAAADNLPIK